MATAAIPIAPVSTQAGQPLPTQIQIVQNAAATAHNNNNNAPKAISLRPCGTARADPAALLAAARSVNPASILRPIGGGSGGSASLLTTPSPTAAASINLVPVRAATKKKVVKTVGALQTPIASEAAPTATGQNAAVQVASSQQRVAVKFPNLYSNGVLLF